MYAFQPLILSNSGLTINTFKYSLNKLIWMTCYEQLNCKIINTLFILGYFWTSRFTLTLLLLIEKLLVEDVVAFELLVLLCCNSFCCSLSSSSWICWCKCCCCWSKVFCNNSCCDKRLCDEDDDDDEGDCWEEIKWEDEIWLAKSKGNDCFSPAAESSKETIKLVKMKALI